jgi:hypothetical protein
VSCTCVLPPGDCWLRPVVSWLHLHRSLAVAHCSKLSSQHGFTVTANKQQGRGGMRVAPTLRAHWTHCSPNLKHRMDCVLQV